jgi:uncharacterized protein YrzB (UPF0473 family)
MASLKTYLLVKLMLIYNYINDTITYYKYKTTELYEYIRDYISGDHDTWIFIPGHSLPISINNIYNECIAVWMYNNRKCTLNFFSDINNRLIVKFSWLSARIRIRFAQNDKLYENEYDIDKFLEDFKIKTHEEIVPTLSIIFLTWCTYSKHWFPKDSNVDFLIIDDNGEEQILNIIDDNECLEIKHNKIYVVIHSDNSDDNENNEVVSSSIILPPSPELNSVNDEIKNKDD